MTNEKKEIRSVLMGRVYVEENGKLTSISAGQFHLPVGVADGATAVRFLGVARRARRCDSTLSVKKTLAAAETTMREIGRGLTLREQPDAVACLIRYVLTRPVVLTFRYLDGVPVLTAWAGRGLTGWISLRRALSAFARHAPEALKLSGRELPKEKEKPRKEKKKRNGKQEAADSTAAEKDMATGPSSAQDGPESREERE